MTSRKRPFPNIDGTLAAVQRELVRRAELERAEGFEGKMPSLDQSASEAGMTYLLSHGSNNAFEVVIPPGATATIGSKLFEPDPEKPTMILANALGALAMYQQSKVQAARWKRCLGLLTELQPGLVEALQDEEDPPMDVVWRSPVMASPLSADAIPCLTSVGILVQRLAPIFGHRTDWSGSELDNDCRKITETRDRLMVGFGDRDIALLVDDGLGGELRDRTERVRYQRKTAKKCAEESGRAFPQEKDPWLVVSSE